MALGYVNLVLDLYDGTGTPVIAGNVLLTPNAIVLDAADHVVLTQSPVKVSLFGSPLPSVEIVATDSGGLTPPGWGWLIQPQFPGAPPGQVFAVELSNGPVQYLSELLAAASAPGPGAADGYAWIPSLTGAPTATPPAITGMVPLVIDVADKQIWAYISGTWVAITLS